MTACNITLTPQRGWIGTDTALYRLPLSSMPAAYATHDVSEARAVQAELGKLGKPRLAGSTAKTKLLPRAKIITAGVGIMPPIAAWFEILAQAEAGIDFDELAERDAAPLVLGQVKAAAEKAAGFELNFIVMALGWSQKCQRVTGYAFAGGDGFQPQEIPDGHSISPAIVAAPDDLAWLAERWDRAAAGEGVEAFHLALGRAQMRAWQEGTSPIPVGGSLEVSEVSEAGVRRRTVGRL